MYFSHKPIDDNKILLYAWFSAMFTRVDILISSEKSGEELKNIATQIENEVKRVEAFANRFDVDSEISQINCTAFENTRIVSDELFQILAECLIYNKQTLGYFDITVNSTLGLKDKISHIFLDNENQTIRFLHPDVKIDLSGFIKGYVLRAIRTLLDKEKIDNALINIGNSSILALGDHPHGKGWKISFPEMPIEHDCVLNDECLTTSGNKENTTWPVLHPQTGTAVKRMNSISVITYDPALGEVLSTALYIADYNEKEVILRQLNGKIVNFKNIFEEI